MKTPQRKPGVAEKKPQTTAATVLTGAVSSTPATGDAKACSAFESPSAAVWSRYIDSRMKQFGTR